MATPGADEIAASISTYLTSKHIPPTQNWLQSFIPTIRLSTPIVALQKTAVFRILSTDITTSIIKSPTNTFPANITDPQTKERHLRGPIIVQVLDVEDIGRSRWSQVEALEAQERGETTKGREVIRVVPDEQNNADTQQTQGTSSGPHKLLLQDASGNRVYAMEVDAVNGVNIQMAIGTKMVLKDFVVARGVVLLEPKGVEVLGGKVEAWEKKWREERKKVLKQKAGMREVG